MRVRRWAVSVAAAVSVCSTTTVGPLELATAFTTQAAAPAQPPLADDGARWSADHGSDAISLPRYRGVSRSSRYLVMRDSVRLAIDVYLPQDLETGARLPAILEQTRYFRSVEFRPNFREADQPAPHIVEFVTRGYAYVISDVRGTGASFGTRRAELSRLEVADGRDIVDWIIEQPWSDGKLGATGVSYVGSTAELLLGVRHPAVKAVVPRFALFDAYTDIVFPGGIHQTWFSRAWQQAIRGLDLNQVAAPARDRITGVRPADEDPNGSLLALAIEEHATNDDVDAGLSSITFRDDRTSSGWTLDELSAHSYVRDAAASGAAIYSYSGWFDGGYPHSAIKRFMTLRNRGSRLILGPWSHGGRFVFTPGGGTKRSGFDHTRELLRFFDHHLKGIDTGVASEPPVHYYTMGEERWKTANTWPVAGTHRERWYLSSDHTLSRARPRQAGSLDTYRVDVTAGTGGAARWNTLVGGGPVDYPDRSADDRKLLTYTSAPLAADLEVTGHPMVTLFVSSSATDGQFFLYLEQVDEAGRVGYVTEGQLRALHRKLSDARPPYRLVVPYRTFLRRDARPLVPGQVATLTFDLLPTSVLFRKGHRLRVALAGADKDHFAVWPGDPPTLEVHRGAQYASSLDLPIVPR